MTLGLVQDSSKSNTLFNLQLFQLQQNLELTKIILTAAAPSFEPLNRPLAWAIICNKLCFRHVRRLRGAAPTCSVPWQYSVDRRSCTLSDFTLRNPARAAPALVAKGTGWPFRRVQRLPFDSSPPLQATLSTAVCAGSSAARVQPRPASSAAATPFLRSTSCRLP